MNLLPTALRHYQPQRPGKVAEDQAPIALELGVEHGHLQRLCERRCPGAASSIVPVAGVAVFPTRG